ncbi:hypothetical protein CCP3SC5AM1_1750007 [Gammaproteobacteria bacterium]
MTVSWVQKNFWECVQDICNACGAECFVDANKVLIYSFQDQE